MSLDVCLTVPGVQHSTEDRIFIREDGQTKAITRAEWDARGEDREPVTASTDDGGEVYTANITHNLNRMAREAGIYEVLWRPEEIGITHAAQLIAPLTDGLALLRSDPERFERFNPVNAWGSYEGLVRFVVEYLEACTSYPTAEVSVWI